MNLTVKVAQTMIDSAVKSKQKAEEALVKADEKISSAVGKIVVMSGELRRQADELDKIAGSV